MANLEPAPGESGSGGGSAVPLAGHPGAAATDRSGELGSAVAELAREVAVLRAELASRHGRDLAVGVLVAQLGVEPADAAEHLARLADSTGLAQADLAADILSHATGTVASAPDSTTDALAAARPLRRAAVAAESGDDLGEVAATLLEEGLRPLGVTGLLLWRRTTTGCLRLVGRAGLSSLEAAHWQWLPPQWPSLLQQAEADGTPRWLPTGPTAPDVLPGQAGDAARAVLPLRHQGTPVGVALAVWPGPAELDEEVRRLLNGLTEVAARILHAQAEAAQEPAGHPVLATLLDLLTHPGMTLRADPDSATLHVEHLNPAAEQAGSGLPRPAGRPLAQLFPLQHAELAELVHRAQATGSPQRAPRLAAAGPGALADVRALPLAADRAVVLWQPGGRERHTEVALAATYERLTSVQAQAALRHQLALQLQHAIVPEVPALQKLPGLQVAARYRPAAQEYRVGGDWYDVAQLPTGQILVAVGDVAGHGIDAATGMVALRHALRGLAFTVTEPARLMECLNQVTLHTPGHPTATAICALYDPASRELRWSSAGHLPPLLLRDGHAHLLDSARDILLGAVPAAEYRQTSTGLRSGDTLLLYTDGLVERRHAGLDETLAILRRAAERLAPGEIDEQADRLLADAVGDTDDDTSLVVLRVL